MEYQTRQGNEIPDIKFKDPDPKLYILPEHSLEVHKIGHSNISS